jgi:hypothetical protein
MSSAYNLSFLLFCALFHCSHSLYFHIGETERKCFIEEIPDETNVVGTVPKPSSRTSWNSPINQNLFQSTTK